MTIKLNQLQSLFLLSTLVVFRLLLPPVFVCAKPSNISWPLAYLVAQFVFITLLLLLAQRQPIINYCVATTIQLLITIITRWRGRKYGIHTSCRDCRVFVRHLSPNFTAFHPLFRLLRVSVSLQGQLCVSPSKLEAPFSAKKLETK